MSTELYERIRTLSNISIQQLEIELGIKAGVIQKWKTSTPRIDNFSKVAKRLGVTMEYLWSGDEELNQKDERAEVSQTVNTEKYTSIPRINNKMSFRYTEKNSGIVYELPVNKQCPICGILNAPEFIGAFPTFKKDIHCHSDSYVGLFGCNSCGKLYSVLYEKPIRTDIFNGLNYDYHFSVVTPMPTVDACYTPYQPPLPEINDCFDNVAFAKFREAYKDVCLAESFGINGLVGMAYRRAVEFLVKDYAILNNIPLEEKNKERWLKTIIKDLPDKRIAAFAASTNAIANDYTHYATHHANRDIKDIKKFFNMLLLEIQKELEFSDALTVKGVEKCKGLQKQDYGITETNPDKKAIATEFTKSYEDLIQDESFQKTAKLYNAYDEDFRAVILDALIQWLTRLIQTEYKGYPLPKEILGY